MLLKGRYEVLRSLSARSRLARDRKTEQAVVVKEIVVKELTSWEALKRLEAEAETLSTVDHPAVPALVSFFSLDEETPDPRFFLVREHVEGQPVSSLVGRRCSKKRLLVLTRALLSTLGDLHDLSPPLLHGDLSPDAIVEKSDGSLAILDFGLSAQLRNETLSGYHAPERVSGHTTVASDLYSAGAIIWSLATGLAPDQLSHEGGAPCLDGALAAPFTTLLFRLLHHDPAQRPQSAEDALALLDAPTALALRQPTDLTAPRRVRHGKTLGVFAAGTLVEIIVALFSPGAALALLPPLVALLYLTLRSERQDTDEATTPTPDKH